MSVKGSIKALADTIPARLNLYLAVSALAVCDEVLKHFGNSIFNVPRQHKEACRPGNLWCSGLLMEPSLFAG